LFLLLLPKIAINLEYDLLDLNETDPRDLLNNLLKSVLRDHIFVTDFWNLNFDDFKRLCYTQASTFKKMFLSLTKDKYDLDSLDQVLITTLKVSIEYLYKLDPNNQGIENAIGQCRREFRGNTWLEDYDTFRHVTETILLNLEKMNSNQIPALIFYMAKSLELLINEIEEFRAKGIINLVYIDSQFVQMKRGEEYKGIVATLSLDKASKTATLKFHEEKNLVERRSAQRLAHSVVKFGFEMPDKTRVGMNFQLEVHESEFT
jgi:hypothetical protein